MYLYLDILVSWVYKYKNFGNETTKVTNYCPENFYRLNMTPLSIILYHKNPYRDMGGHSPAMAAIVFNS